MSGSRAPSGHLIPDRVQFFASLAVALVAGTLQQFPSLEEKWTARAYAIEQVVVTDLAVRSRMGEKSYSVTFDALAEGGQRRCGTYHFNGGALDVADYQRFERLRTGKAAGTLKVSARNAGRCWIDPRWSAYGWSLAGWWLALLLLCMLANGVWRPNPASAPTPASR